MLPRLLKKTPVYRYGDGFAKWSGLKTCAAAPTLLHGRLKSGGALASLSVSKCRRAAALPYVRLYCLINICVQ